MTGPNSIPGSVSAAGSVNTIPDLPGGPTNDSNFPAGGPSSSQHAVKSEISTASGEHGPPNGNGATGAPLTGDEAKDAAASQDTSGKQQLSMQDAAAQAI